MNCKHRGELISKQEKVACEGIEGLNITRPSYKCDIHKRCIVAYNPKGKLLTQWNQREESKMFKLCMLCSEHCPLSQSENSER